jgi:Transposase DDE domain
VRADLDTLLIAVYCAACSLFPTDPRPRRGRPQAITDNELLCLMVAQMLLGQPSDRRFLAVAGCGRCFRGCPANRATTSAVGSWRRSWSRSGARSPELPGFHDSLSFIDTTPLPCGQSVGTVNRSQLAPWCGFGYCAAHSRFYWGMRLVLWCGPDGTVRDFELVPANAPEREAVLELLERQPPVGQLVIADKGFAGREFEDAVAELGALLLRPNRGDEPNRRSPPIGKIRQRIESIVNSLKDQLRLEHHLARTPAGLLCRIAARILALNAAIHLNWQLDQPHRALTTYGH